jgi:predicted nucleic acid binding AN1-type Zn finger protein
VAMAMILTNFSIGSIIYAKSFSDIQVESLSQKIVSFDTMESSSKNSFKVEVKVKNSGEQPVNMYAIFTSYDEKGNALETKSSYAIVSDDDYEDISTTLKNLDRVTKVQVGIAESTTNKVELLSQGSCIDGNNIKATAVVMNGTPDKKSVNVIFTSYDSNGKALETRSDYSSYVSKNSSWDTSASLKNLDKVAKVDVKVVDANSNKIDLVSQGSYIDGKNIKITATITNGTADKKSVNVVFTSYDINGKALETRSDNSSYVSGNSSWNTSASLKNLDKVAKVDVKVVDANSNKIDLVSQGSYIDEKNIKVTATITNGTADKKSVNVVFTSYDINGKALETRSDNSSYVSGNSSWDTSSSLKNLSNVAKVEAKVIEPNTDKIELVSQGYYIDKNKVVITAVAANGYKDKDSKNVKFSAISYDAKGKMLETPKSNFTVASSSIKDCNLSLNFLVKNKQVSSIKIFLNNVEINTINIPK